MLFYTSHAFFDLPEAGDAQEDEGEKGDEAEEGLLAQLTERTPDGFYHRGQRQRPAHDPHEVHADGIADRLDVIVEGQQPVQGPACTRSIDLVFNSNKQYI